MTMLLDDRNLPLGRDDDEGLFSRDMNGQLVRLDKPVEADYLEKVTLKIDGKEVIVPLAEPRRDAQGNVIVDIEGRTTPRYTTIYDAAVKLSESQKDHPGKISIPILCHQPHIRPVAVCRVCVVQIYGTKRGKRTAERKLLPACQHQVKEGMEVFTMDDPGDDGKRVRESVSLLTELLAGDHLNPHSTPRSCDVAPFNELHRMTELCGIKERRFSGGMMAEPARANRSLPLLPTGPKGFDDSSPVFLVDHAACILCDRCSRACDDVKKNNVIGRTGKGASTAIGFDLDFPIGKSSCVQCGECMISCPTSAITFNAEAKVNLPIDETKPAIAVEELSRDPLFKGVPPKLLLWQEGLVRRRSVKAKEMLCHQGDPGNIAFVIKRGRVEITAWPPDAKTGKGGLHQLRIKGRTGEPLLRETRGPEDILVGEMACMSGTPRNADLKALEDGEVWEVRRNILDRLLRLPGQGNQLQAMFRTHALDLVVRTSDIFRQLPKSDFARCADFLRPLLSFVHVNPRQTIFKQGDWAENIYFIRLGHVRVDVDPSGPSASLVHRGPGTVIGEIGLLAITPQDLGKNADVIDAELASALDCRPEELTGNLPAGRRTATCTALDDVELARVTRSDFLKLVQQFPPVRRQLVDIALDRLRRDRESAVPAMREFIEQGLYQGQSILALDLDTCTRCDECT
jgi:CRP-like cAMP-binding protein/NAD-dependent dihydropyrimidine dehydrogenase PreA subunit